MNLEQCVPSGTIGEGRRSRLMEFNETTKNVMALAREVRDMSGGIADNFTGPMDTRKGVPEKEKINTGLLGEWQDTLEIIQSALVDSRANLLRIDC